MSILLREGKRFQFRLVVKFRACGFSRHVAVGWKEAAAQIREVRVIYNEGPPWELLKGCLGSHSFIHRVRYHDGSDWLRRRRPKCYKCFKYSLAFADRRKRVYCWGKPIGAERQKANHEWNKQDLVPPGVHDIQQIVKSCQNNPCAHFWVAIVVRTGTFNSPAPCPIGEHPCIDHQLFRQIIEVFALVSL